MTVSDLNLASAPKMDKKQLIEDLTTLVINAVNLHHLPRTEIHPDTAFGAGGLNLDSVDILEIVVTVEQTYKVKVSDAEVGKKYFGSIGGIAEFLTEPRT